LKITFLGTGTSQGVPVIGCNCEVCSSLDFRDNRLRTSVHIAVKGKSFVIDTGPDFRQQMLRERIKHLDAVIYTHQHKDHIAGMDEVRSFNFKQGIDMPVYGTREVLQQLKKEFSYVFESEKYPGVPRIHINEISNHPFKIGPVKFIPIRVMHFKMPVLGFRVQDFTYITDANLIPESEIPKLMDSKVLVINALQINKHISHFNLEEALEVVELIQPQKAYFTHISHRLGLHSTVQRKLPDHVELAWDGLKLSID